MDSELLLTEYCLRLGVARLSLLVEGLDELLVPAEDPRSGLAGGLLLVGLVPWLLLLLLLFSQDTSTFLAPEESLQAQRPLGSFAYKCCRSAVPVSSILF